MIGVFFGISLCWLPLMRVLKRLFFEADKPRPAPAPPVFFTPANTLPPELAAAPAVADLDTQEIKQTAPVEGFSVTEESTSPLKSSESI
jgi:hypothetical protein